MAHRLAMETIRLQGNAARVTAEEFIAAVGASENGSETEMALARYVRRIYDRVSAAGAGMQDGAEGWDAIYCVGTYGTDSYDERALRLKSAIELTIQGNQILNVGWEWKAGSSWQVDA